MAPSPEVFSLREDLTRTTTTTGMTINTTTRMTGNQQQTNLLTCGIFVVFPHRFGLYPSLLLSSPTVKRFYALSGDILDKPCTGHRCLPFSPPYKHAFILSRIGFGIPTARRLPSKFCQLLVLSHIRRRKKTKKKPCAKYTNRGSNRRAAASRVAVTVLPLDPRLTLLTLHCAINTGQ